MLTCQCQKGSTNELSQPGCLMYSDRIARMVQSASLKILVVLLSLVVEACSCEKKVILSFYEQDCLYFKITLL